METNYYRNFIIIVESGSITSAAEVLHTTEPTLSKQMQVLENMLQTELLVTKRGLNLCVLPLQGRYYISV
ncbi:LysR family transcriptional regulator [Veillonella absiana]